ncbi:hypothetical protein CN404_15370 [Bacillus thuringiensis]|uniref:hypothetical protein n=1 Tax=Bacillus thuringiensis TaxID=1428 RepID=UPI000BF338E7|nr:hypothetical protein [Bacillus thuringiensis]PFB53338.1 hypothetical protein CN404_15370 [Bacillus thuringiensis]
MKQAMEYDQLEIRIHELEKVMREENNRRLYERYQAIILYLKGYTNIKTAEIRNTVREFIQKVNQQPQQVIDRLCLIL